jgi:hypothetical protein
MEQLESANAINAKIAALTTVLIIHISPKKKKNADLDCPCIWKVLDFIQSEDY